MPRYKKINNQDLIEIPISLDKKASTIKAVVTGMSYSCDPETGILDKVGVTATRRLTLIPLPFIERLKYLLSNKPIIIDEHITLLGEVKKLPSGRATLSDSTHRQ